MSSTAAAERTPRDVTALMQLLDSEVSRLKRVEHSQKETVDKLSRDETRHTVMLRLSEEQLRSSKETQQRFRQLMEESKEEARVRQEECEKLTRRVAQLEDGLKASRLQQEKASQQSAATISQLTAQCAQQESTLTRLRKELEDAQVAQMQSGEVAQQASRESQRTIVTLETRLKEAEEQLSFVEELRKKETKDVTLREVRLNAEIAELKKNARDFRAGIELERTAAFETVTGLRMENESLKLKIAQLEGMTKVSDRDNFEKIQKLTMELAMLKERAEQEQSASAAKIKALETQTATLVTHLKSAQAEVSRLADLEHGSAEDHIQTVIQLNSSKEALRTRLAAVEDQVEELKKAARTKEVAHCGELEQMKRELCDNTKAHQAELALKADELSRVSYELTNTARRMHALEDDLTATKQAAEHKAVVASSEIGALRAEVEGYKASVRKLEEHIQDNYDLRILSEQNESLKNQITQLRNQLTSANNALATVRIESDINETCRIRTLQEQYEAELTKCTSLEKERRCARPLLQDLIEVAQRHNAVDPALARDIDVFFRQFGFQVDEATGAKRTTAEILGMDSGDPQNSAPKTIAGK